MTDGLVVPISQRDPVVNFIFADQDESDVSMWIRSREKKKRTTDQFHACVIAHRLAEYIGYEIARAHRAWCGLVCEDNEFLPRLDYMVGDPEGVRDAFMFVPIPTCFEADRERLQKLVQRETHRIARQYRGFILTYHSCMEGPAR